MVLILMFFLVSLGFESLPLPVSYSSFESRHPVFLFFRIPGKVPHLSTLIFINIFSGFYKTEWKTRVKTQTKREKKSSKGGKKSSASSYWNFFI